MIVFAVPPTGTLLMDGMQLSYALLRLSRIGPKKMPVVGGLLSDNDECDFVCLLYPTQTSAGLLINAQLEKAPQVNLPRDS